MFFLLTIKPAAAYPCSIARQSQQSVVGKIAAKPYTYPSHRLVPPTGIGFESYSLSSYQFAVYPGSHLLLIDYLKGFRSLISSLDLAWLNS